MPLAKDEQGSGTEADGSKAQNIAVIVMNMARLGSEHDHGGNADARGRKIARSRCRPHHAMVFETHDPETRALEIIRRFSLSGRGLLFGYSLL